MKKNIAVGLMMIVAVLFSSGNVYAFDERAKKLFDDGQYEECIERVESLPDFKKQMPNVMLLAFSNYQQYNFTKQKHFKTQSETYYDMLVARAGIDDLNSILFFVNSTDKPAVVKSARGLLKDIFATLHKVEEVINLLPFASSKDEDVRKLAFNTIERILEPIREIVEEGGTMRPADVRYFQNKDLIKFAVENIEISAARNILILIEEPALEALSHETGSAAIKVHEKITKEINDRKKKYPNSTWYSATGKKL